MEPEIPAIAFAKMLFSERAVVVIRLVGRTGPLKEANSERKWNEKAKAKNSVSNKSEKQQTQHDV